MINIPRWVVNKIEEYLARQVVQVPVDSVGTGTATGIPIGWGASITFEVSPHLTLAVGDVAICQKLGAIYIALGKRP